MIRDNIKNNFDEKGKNNNSDNKYLNKNFDNNDKKERDNIKE